MSPTQRTLKYLRETCGYKVGIVERFISNAHLPSGIRSDLFNIIDIIALSPTGIVGVQSCGTAFSQHVKKITIEQAENTRDWLKTPGTSLLLIGWRKVKIKRGGTAMRYEPRTRWISIKDLKFHQTPNPNKENQP